MSKNENSAEDFFSEENVPASSWMKFEKPGDIVMGTFVEKTNKKGNGVMPDQVVFELTNAKRGTATIKDSKISDPKMEDEGTIKVGIKAGNKYILPRLKNIKEGDIIGFAFMEEIPAKTKGYSPAKSISPFVRGVDKEYLDQKNTITVDDAEDAFNDDDFE